MRKIFPTIISMLFVSLVSAQEVLVPSGINQELLNLEPVFRTKGKAMELTMPFYEDFSANFVYPDAARFSDSTVFINTGFAISPMTIGVATFDGLNAHGYLYEHGSNFAFPADTLTSLAIRLDSVFTGTHHATTAADSIYFSFYYQPQGNGEKPDEEDSLLLEFYAAHQNRWIPIWSTSGMSYNDFLTENGSPWKCVMIPITDTVYMNEDFQFRFRNYASYANLSFPTWASNADFWNIDYIFINSERDLSNTIPVDIAFGERKETLLKNYFSMPWNHFLANTAGEMATEINVPYTNFSATLLNVTERLMITDLSETTPAYNSGLSASNLAPQSDTIFYRSPIPYTYTSLVSENAEFEVKMCINTATISDPISSNDTMAFYQRFYNYFAADDGSAEAGYGLTINSGKAALQFKLNTADTLRSVQMFFNRTINDANQIYFNLTIWNDNGGKPGTILYQQLGVRPEFLDGFNNFVTYVLDEPLPVNGIIYVGWLQTTDEVLNLGYDKNNDRHKKFFYNTDGNWYNTLYAGTPMIRIIVGNWTTPHVGIEEDKIEVSVYPNPCNDCRVINFSDSDLKNVTVMNLNGQIVKQEWCANSLSTEGLKPGFYTLMLEKSASQPVFIKWILTK